MDYRKLWETHYGPIPTDENGRTYEIHHIDGNRQNNSIENLMCVSIEEHWKIHYEQGDYLSASFIKQKMGQPINGWKHSDETKQKMSEAKKGIVFSEEHKKNLSLSNKGVKRPGAGNKTNFYKGGHKLSDETRKKMSEAKKGKPTPMLGLEPWNKGKKGLYTNNGWKHTDEAKQKMSEAKKGKPSPMKGKSTGDDTKEKQRKAKVGKTWEEIYGIEGARLRREKRKNNL